MKLLRGPGQGGGRRRPARRMFAGAIINTTEGRAVLHTALRNRANTPVLVDGRGRDAGGERRARCDGAFRQQRCAAASITDVVNIGIGGSDLGPGHDDAGAGALSRRAAASLCLERRRRAYRRHAEGASTPETTLFLIASKTFTTIETMTNARDGAELDRGEAGRGRGGATISRRSPPPSTRSRPSASARTASSASGTGWAGAIPSGRPSACR